MSSPHPVGSGLLGRGSRVDWVPDPPTPPPPPPPVLVCDCGLTDSWERVIAETYNTGASDITGAYCGTSDAGPKWVVQLSRGAACEVNSDLALSSVRVSSSTGFGSASMYLPWPSQAPGSCAYTIRFTPQGISSAIDGGGDYDVVDLHFGASRNSGLGPDVLIRLNPSGAVLLGSRIQVTGGTATSIPDGWWSSLTDYSVTITYGPSGTTASVTDGTTTYSATSTSVLSLINDPYITQNRIVNIISGTHADLHFLYGDLNVVGVNRCTAVQFDNFERTVASDWGTATPSGFVWSPTGISGGNAASTDGSNGIISWVSGSPTMTVSDATGPWSQPSWTMQVRFKTGTWTPAPGGSDGYARMIFKITPSNRTILFAPGSNGVLSEPQGFVQLDGNASIAFPWETDTWYLAKWEYTIATGDAKVKVWQESGTEPDWLDSTPTWGPGDDPPTAFVVGGLTMNAGFPTPYVMPYASIDFDYDGRPCYYDCVSFLFDDFNRSESPGWGDASSGPTWVTDGSSNGLIEVSSGYGILQNGASSTTNIINSTLDLSTQDAFTVTIKLAGDDSLIDVGFIFGGVGFGWHRNNTGVAPYLRINNLGQVTAAFSGTFWGSLADAAYMQLAVNGGTASLTLWDENATQPAPQLVKTGIDRSAATSEIEASMISLSTTSVGVVSVFVDWIEVSYGCTPVGPS